MGERCTAGLDRQGSSTGTAPHAPAQRRSPFPPPTLPPHLSSDAALALALASDELSAAPSTSSTFDHDRALALALAHDDARTPATSSSSTSDTLCPICGASWAERGLSLPAPSGDFGAARARVLQRREAHTQACLEAIARFEDEEGGAAGAGMHGTADEEGEGEGMTSAREGMACGKGKRPWTGDVGGSNEVRGTAGTLAPLSRSRALAARPDAPPSSPTGLIHVLRHALKQSNFAPQGRTREAWLATTTTEHIPTRVKDWGWGCG